jgi:hypothetical protein
MVPNIGSNIVEITAGPKPSAGEKHPDSVLAQSPAMACYLQIPRSSSCSTNWFAFILGALSLKGVVDLGVIIDNERFSDAADGQAAERPDESAVAGLDTGGLLCSGPGFAELGRGSDLAECCEDADLMELSLDNGDSRLYSSCNEG